MDLDIFLSDHKAFLENFLTPLIPNKKSSRLAEAMHYSVLNGGKRIRPALIYAIGRTLDIPTDRLNACAAAIELIHCYSLVHDDLPAMDDDDLRRGQPTCHVAYDEATAVLVGDALQSLAFEILASMELNPVQDRTRVQMVATLARASGAEGMVLGQDQDMRSKNKKLAIDVLRSMHANKTGTLFVACGKLALLAGENINTDMSKMILKYCKNIGIAFQIQDDVLDVTGDESNIGKPINSDIDNDKSTYVTLLGVDEAKKQADDALEVALAEVASFDHSMILNKLATFIVKRTY